MNENKATLPSSWKIGPWKILRDGTMEHESPGYYIEGHRLGEPNWIQHMAEKRWCDLRIFVRAYLFACQVRKLKTVTIRTDMMF